MLKLMHVEGGPNFYGGARQVAFLVEGLAQRGVENFVVVPRDSLTARRIAALPVHCLPIAIGGDLDLGLIGRLRRLIRQHRPDILHLHSRRGPEVLGAMAGRLEGVPVIYSRRIDNPETRLLVPLKYRLYDRVIAISQAIADVLAAHGVPREKLRVVRSAFMPEAVEPLSREALRHELGMPADSFVVAVIAQLIRRKGHALLLQAMPQLLAAIPDLRVVFFGKGPLAEELQTAIQAQKLSERVQLAGFREDLPRLIGALDLVAHPAYAEGLGVSLLQASAAGVPIVAARAGGIPEAVHDGVNGLLVPPGDAQALGQAIITLAQDPARRAGMAQAARALIAGEFSVDTMVEGNLAVYRELLAEKTRSR